MDRVEENRMVSDLVRYGEAGEKKPVSIGRAMQMIQQGIREESADEAARFLSQPQSEE